MTNYTVKLTTLTPLHIGDGTDLRNNFDYIVQGDRTYRLNTDTILEAFFEKAMQPKRNGIYLTPGELLAENTANATAQADYIRYHMPGVPRSGKTFAELKSFIKDVNDRPYVPGSSLKGALRTAVAWGGLPELNQRLQRSDFGRSKSWAGQGVERTLFGSNPNKNLFRALQVSDLSGTDAAGARLSVVNAQVLTRREVGSPIELEAIAGDAVFTGTLKIDDTLFTAQAERVLRFNNRKHWLTELPQRVQAHSKERIEKLANWFANAEGATRAAKFYRQLAAAKVPANMALLQLGWGSGWDGKTFGSRISADSQLFEHVIRQHRLQRRPRSAPPRRAGAAFPSSRRVAVQNDNVIAPFGWCLLQLTKVE